MKRIVFIALSCLVIWVGGAIAAQADKVYTIYPVPQMQQAVEGEATFSQQVAVVCEPDIDAATQQRALSVLKEHGLEAEVCAAPVDGRSNIYIGVAGSGGVADGLAGELGLDKSVCSREGKFDRHLLSLTQHGGHARVVILGENTDAAFFALASLEQMLDNGTSFLPCVTIYDFADQQSRGIVEGYYGYPYSVTVKKDLMRFMMRHKMNTYLYGAKSDPYHSQYWKQAYPATITPEQEENGWLSQDMVREVADVAHECKVQFIWAIHPGDDFTGSSTVISDIMGKFDKMYNLGVRQFAVFVDDVSVPTDDATIKLNADRLTELQRKIEEKYNTPAALPTDTVKPLHFVPQVYTLSWVAADIRRKFYQALAATPSYITIYITGYGVWTVPNSNDLLTVRNDLGRDAAWWWNYPCNDNADGQIYPMDMYTNFTDMPDVTSGSRLPASLQNGLGIVSNPMQQGEVAKTPLFSVADYAWNNAGFSNAESWEASFAAILSTPEKQKAYRKLAPYLTYNDPAQLQTLIGNFKTSLATNPAPEALLQEMGEVLEACAVVEGFKDSDEESDRLLYHDLAPWLLKLKAMATAAKGMLEASAMTDAEEKWITFAPNMSIVDGLDKEEAYKAYALEGMGNSISVSVRPSQPSERYLLPFLTYLQENVMSGLLSSQTVPTGPVLLTDVEKPGATVGTENNGVYLTAAKVVLQPGNYVGFTLKDATKLSGLLISDTLTLANYNLLYSADGKEWAVLNDVTTVPEGFVKHICLQNATQSVQSLRLTKRIFRVDLPALPTISAVTVPSGNAYTGTSKSNITDGDYTTFFTLDRNQASGDAYMLTLSTSTVVNDVRVCIGTVNGDYMNTGKVQVSADGTTWKDLKVAGTSLTSFTMSTPQVVTYSDEMKYCDFDGLSDPVRYVRLYLASPNTSKWLRLYEIEVNKRSYAASFTPVCADAQGNALTAASDTKFHTSTADAQGGSLTYYFQNCTLLNGVTVYQDPTALAQDAPSVSVTADGTNWTALAPLANAVQVYDLADMPNAKAMRVAWNGSNAPLIYEIVEQPDATKRPAVTGMESVVQDEGISLSLIPGGAVTLTSAKGIRQLTAHSADGRLLYAVNCNGSRTCHVPATGCKGVLILRVVQADGKEVPCKVLVK